MLTNNKKRSFVKLLALTLAALMVFSVCLTGCTDEDARTAAQNAQNAADAAQSAANAAQSAADAKTTAEAVAAQITEALKPYLKADAAMTEADVKAAIENALTGYQAKGDYATKTDLTNALKDYMKSSEALTKKAVEDMLKSYQAKGDYATKSDLTAALKDYAKSDDVTVAVANYITKTEMAAALESFATFAKSEDLSALSDALTDAMDAALTADDVADLITEALVDYATTAYVDEAIAAAKEAEREITTAEIAEAIQKALADYDVTIKAYIDEADAKLEALIESYFGAFAPEQVVALLENVDKSMDAEEWAAATVMVTRVLKKTSDLFKKVHDNSYTQERKAEINAIMAKINGLDTHVVVFKTIENKGGDWNDGKYLDDFHYEYMHDEDLTKDVDVRTASAKILTDLTVFILRAATTAEIAGIESAIDAATKVPTFTDDMSAWITRLYKVGKEVAVMTDKDGNTSGAHDYTKQKKWAGLNGDHGTMYHSTNVRNDGVMKAQVATAADRATYDQLVADLERLVVEYTLEAPRFAANEAKGQFTLKSLHVTTKSNGAKTYTWAEVGKYKNETMYGMNVSALNSAKAENFPTPANESYTFLGVYAGIDKKQIPDAAETSNMPNNWTPDVYGETVTFGYVMQGYFDNYFLDPQIKVDLVNDKYATADSKLKTMLNAYTPKTATGSFKEVELAETYNALSQMITDAETANAKANALFTSKPGQKGIDADKANHKNGTGDYTEGFLWHIGHNYVESHKKSDGSYVCNCSLYSLTDNTYVNLLKDYMVEWTETEAHAVVPADWNKPVWLSPVYDVEDTVAPWNYNGAHAEQAKTIDVYFNYAHNINGYGYMPESYSYITGYDLYLKLVDKAWELLYEKYKSYAAQVLLTMRNDFRVAAKAAAQNSSADSYTATANLEKAANALSLKLVATDVSKTWTADFVGNYYEGTNSYSWYVGNSVPKQIGPAHTFEGLDHYYEYNEVAKRANAVGGSKAIQSIKSDVLGAVATSQLLIDIELDSVTVGPREDILTDAANYLNSGMSEFEWKKANKKRVQDAFDDELKLAKENFEEIMYRYMHKEINEAYINFAYASVNALNAANEFNAAKNPAAGDNYGLGVATYFDKNPESTAISKTAGKENAMAYFMQVYVTGYSALNGMDDVNQGYTWVWGGEKGDQLIGINYKQNVAYLNNVTVASADVYNKLMANVMTASDYAVGKTIEHVATAKLANAKAIYNEAINTMANAAVEYRFNDYIQHAKDATYFAYLAYAAVAPNYAASLALTNDFNEAINALTITQYYSERGLIADMDYLNTYVTQILGVAIAHDSPYYTLIATDTNYGKQLVNIKSSTTMLDTKAAGLQSVYNPDLAWKKANMKKEWVANVDSNNNGKIQDDENYAGNLLVIIPQAPLQAYQNYFATGSAALSFDITLNGNDEIAGCRATADNGTKLY